MSKAPVRVKRSYDNYCGEEMAVSTSPACSPLRITSLGQQQAAAAASFSIGQSFGSAHQPASALASNPHLPPSSASAPSPFSSSSNCFAPATQRSLFGSEECKESVEAQQFRGFAHHSARAQQAAASSPSSLQSPRGSPPPQYSSPSVAAAAHTAAKRSRRAGAADVSMTDDSADGEATMGVHESPFPTLKRAGPIDDLLVIPRSFKKQAVAAALAGPSSAAHATPIAASLASLIPPPPSTTTHLPSYHHQLFTYDQVASIVKNAVKVREEEIRAEYDVKLQELLREQFENFSSFNRAYISRNMQQLDKADDDDNSYSYYS